MIKKYILLFEMLELIIIYGKMNVFEYYFVLRYVFRIYKFVDYFSNFYRHNSNTRI